MVAGADAKAPTVMKVYGSWSVERQQMFECVMEAVGNLLPGVLGHECRKRDLPDYPDNPGFVGTIWIEPKPPETEIG